VKFVELEPLNTRKNGGYAATREANSGIRKKPAAAVARETAPLGLGVLIALGGILVMMSYLSE